MANDVHQLIMVGNSAGEFFETVQHFEASQSMSADPVTASNNLIAGFIANVQGPLLDVMAADTSIVGYKSKRVNNGGGPTVMFPITPVPGNVAGTSATSGTAYVIVNRFSHSGAFKTGRWFIPGVPEANLTGNHFTAGAISDVATMIASLESFSSGSIGYTYGTWSPKFTLFFIPTYLALSNKVGIQRRRLLPVL